MAPHLAGLDLVVGVQQVIPHTGHHTIGQHVHNIRLPLVKVDAKAGSIGHLRQLQNHIGQKRKLLGPDGRGSFSRGNDRIYEAAKR